ncbi:HNH endonuclease [Alkalihalobacillus macyae]|uniref:HNH endonuclease n=1 Tax=Guptibacillus hwajinpoensis TaxID=208199 RepID=UPI00273CD930|nr:HNH endonuclease [Alkalihalobacillus macyae]MDP4549779.1 HNH endonuclease [Alkalihalobacillus macyae]
MNCFIVMQGDTYQEEKDACVIWSPKEDKSGNEPHSWKRLKEVHAGDQLFHYVRGNIVAVSIVKKDCKEAHKPSTLLNHHKTTNGYLVQLEYYELDIPVNVKEHFQEIYPLLPLKYAPFQNDANGNPGYLYPCNEELAIKLLELISESNFYRVDEEQLELTIDEVRKIERNTLVPFITEIESEAKTKIRWGEQKFRKDLMPLWEDKCAICAINLPVLLNASRSKPWKDSTNQERLDPYNGLLLCSNHDALYHEGLIAFDGQGRLHISSIISEEDYEMYRLMPRAKIRIHPENKVYFKWHKRNVFASDVVNELHSYDSE